MLIKGGIPAALTLGFPFLKALTITIAGGMTGSVFFILFWDKVITLIKNRRLKKQHNSNVPLKKKFTFKNKLLIRIKKRFGLLGIAAATPLFSYFFGCYIAVRYYQREKQRVVIYMFISTFMWSLVVFSIKLFLNY
jgi:Sec-independent protein secretion pathway component TatC